MYLVLCNRSKIQLEVVVSLTLPTSPRTSILNKLFDYPWDDSLQLGLAFDFVGIGSYEHLHCLVVLQLSKVAFKELVLERT